MKIRSTAFGDGDAIPRKFTGEGKDISPPLVWEQVPEKTRELVLICDDPDAPTPSPFVHWLLYGLQPDADGVPEGGPPAQRSATAGRNSFKKDGYGGPMPPPGHGVHHYHFKLYALDEPTGLPPGADRAAIEKAISGHILEDCELVGTYER